MGRWHPLHSTSRVLLAWMGKVGMGEMVRCGRRAAHGSEPDDDVSIIGPGMEVLGGINGEGSVRVEGKVGGPVRTSGSLVVGKGGRTGCG